MKKKKFRALWEETKKKCCIKEFLELENLAKYGPISILLIVILIQSYNIIIDKDFKLSLISILINLFFLLIVLIKLDIIKIDTLKPYLNYALKLLIFIFLLNFIMYILTDDLLYQCVYAPINFIGAYFIFLLLNFEAK